MISSFILGYLGKSALDAAKSRGAGFLKHKQARRELAEIAERSIEAAVKVVPALSEDLRSKTFIEGAVGPLLETVVRDPATLPDPAALSAQFIQMFVEQFAKRDGIDDTLIRLFQTRRDELQAAFVELLVELRRELTSSTHWREIASVQREQETLTKVSTLLEVFEASLAPPWSNIDIDAARSDARAGSGELRSWPRDIDGQELHRPERARLLAHLAANPAGSSLLIGDAGSGKSALLSNLTSQLEKDGVTVFAIKADTIPSDVRTIVDVGKALGMRGPFDREVMALATQGRVVLLIDQLDAVSEVMDRSSARMRIMLQLVREIRDSSLPVHVLVSSRPFEADHDARFQQLKAERFTLALPPIESVVALLEALGLSAEGVDPKLLETLRRPFALKLFVEIAERGADVKAIRPGSLLNAWLASAKLGNDAERAETLALMEKLAAEMIATETLWRPADRYEASALRALARAEACGLIVRSDTKVGFSHQSWLDDFQAKGFHTGKNLSEYAWKSQDSLFARATILRTLERFRSHDEKAYESAVRTLLFDVRTRRHIKHLIVDIVSSATEPTSHELAWVETLVRTDPILANRALGRAIEHWPGWRGGLKHLLALLMTSEDFQWRAVQVLAAEAKYDPDAVADLIGQHWNSVEHDGFAFRVVELAGAFTPKVEAIFRTILTRSPVDQYSVSHFVSTLRAEGRVAEASRVAAIWVSTLEITRHSSLQLHDVGKLAEAAPKDFSAALLPWFVSLAGREVEPYLDGVRRFPKSTSLPWDWDFDRGEDSPIDALRTALKRVAAQDPDEARALIAPLLNIEIEEVQELIADTLAAGGKALANDGFAFLMDDIRRFQIGDAHVTIEPGVSGSEAGLCTQELIGAIAPHLQRKQQDMLVDAIERWRLYGPEYRSNGNPQLKRHLLQTMDQERLELLDRLPHALLTSRRKRQIAEWRRLRPRPKSRSTGREMATFVGSPMSVAAMVKASDDSIIKMLDEMDDMSSRRPRRRPLSMDGGVTELSRAFAAFGKEQPDRALNIAENRLVPGRHERVAGELVHLLARESDVAPDRLHRLILTLTAKGFGSNSWKRDAGWALASIAQKMEGLDEPTIALLESWLDNDPTRIAERIAERIKIDAENASRNRRERGQAEPVLFDRMGGGRSLPQDNYTFLSAMFHGLLNRKIQAFDEWLAVLERHSTRPEDPHVWTTTLIFEGRWLYWADRDRTRVLLDRLWAADPSIFDDIELLPMVWGTRAMFSPQLLTDMLERWLAAPDERQRQGAAEFIQAGVLVAPQDAIFESLAQKLDDTVPELLQGRLFAAAAAWREDVPSLRRGAHSILMQHVSDASGDAAHAISGAVERTDQLIADDMTVELVLAIANNPDILGQSLNGRFANGLQALLLFPGFDEPVLEVADKVSDLVVAKQPGRYLGMVGEDFVQVTVALQRSDGPLRTKAMDIYERLLDAGAYGAEQAATDALGR
jgi:hypothetical protein